MNLQNAEFVLSAASVSTCPHDGLPQIVFAGRSNVGKSSVINRLLRRKNFARVGGKPGKTIHINFFSIDRKCYFVDIPGYGYAEVSASEKARWAALIESYFAATDLMTFGVMIVDARHKPTANDITMAEFFLSSGKPFVVVANKLDKVRRKSETDGNLLQIRSVLRLTDDVRVIPFSAETGTGRDELLSVILNAVGETV
jgi:GTP-binding protein